MIDWLRLKIAEYQLERQRKLVREVLIQLAHIPVDELQKSPAYQEMMQRLAERRQHVIDLGGTP